MRSGRNRYGVSRPANRKIQAEGAVPELYDTMVHFIVDEDQLTFVVDSTEGPMAELVSAVRSGLSDGILHILAEAA